MKILVCASARNLSPAFFAATTEIGHHIGEKKYTLIYGGGDIGLMAEAARASAEAGGLVKGYIPQVFNKITPQQPHTNIKTDVVETIFERKERMLFDSDILLVLPGGIGTYDEIFEGATANDIQCFADDTQKLKPIVIANFPDESGVPYFRGLKLSLEDAVRNKAIDRLA
ncbi:MAG: LOG family protein [Alphaproteobacteria bacterium]|nr:LOG family protein [Alphaproteobacteria bacterium]